MIKHWMPFLFYVITSKRTKTKAFCMKICCMNIVLPNQPYFQLFGILPWVLPQGKILLPQKILNPGAKYFPGFWEHYSLACRIPSSERSVSWEQKSSFSNLTTEKSLSTCLIPGNTEASPPQKLSSSGKWPFWIFHKLKNEVCESLASNVCFSHCSCDMTTGKAWCCCSNALISQCMKVV